MSLIFRTTHTIDATGEPLGRLASRIAILLMGKRKRDYQPNVDDGGWVTIKNASKIHINARTLDQKEYKHYSGYPGGLKRIRWSVTFAKNPEKLLRLAVLRMLPKNRLRAQRIKRLTIE